MRTIVLGPPTAELAALIARRRSLGLDTHDEVWKGDYHMAPAAHGSRGYVLSEVVAFLRPVARRAGLFSVTAFNLGTPDDFRVPDCGLLETRPDRTWFDTAALVVEIEAPDDETWDKLAFYAEHGVEEVLVVSSPERSVIWLRRDGGTYITAEHSRLLGEDSLALTRSIDWPPAATP